MTKNTAKKNSKKRLQIEKNHKKIPHKKHEIVTQNHNDYVEKNML